jgi:hypothetical protein
VAWLLAAISASNSVYAKPVEIDLLVAYSGAAVERIGGAAVMERAINFAVVNANAIYRNNQINQRLRLVHTAPVDFHESSVATTEAAVVALQQPNDGQADAVHGLRNQSGADLVMLVVDGDVWPDWTGGDANVLYENTTSLSEYAAFSLVDWEFLETTVTFPHELGHSMGLQHDWYLSASELVPYPYARGYVNPDAGWRTIMAYDNECKAKGKDCPRIPYFSSPDLTYQGLPLGVREGTNTSCRAGSANNSPCDANAVKTLNNTAATVAAFRSTVVDNSLGVANLLAPSGTVQTYIPKFSWNPVANATRYRLLVGIAPAAGTTVDALPDGKAILLYEWYNAANICNASVCAVTPAVNFSNGNHYWMVQAHNASGWGQWNDARDFTLFSPTMTGGPDVVPLLPNTSVADGRPTFYWQPAHGGGGVPAATQYLILAWDFDRNQTVYLTPWYNATSVCNVQVCAATPPDALPAGNYLWRIRSNSTYGEGVNSVRLNFSVNPAPCSATGNQLDVLASAYLLTLQGLCYQGVHYPRETTLQFNMNGTWQLVGQADLTVPTAPCPAASNGLQSDGSYLSLTVPSFCYNATPLASPGNLHLNLNGTWGIVPRP